MFFLALCRTQGLLFFALFPPFTGFFLLSRSAVCRTGIYAVNAVDLAFVTAFVFRVAVTLRRFA
jgi:hypothetical protein